MKNQNEEKPKKLDFDEEIAKIRAEREKRLKLEKFFRQFRKNEEPKKDS